MLGRGLQQHEANSMTSNKGETNWRTKPGEYTNPADKAVDSHFAGLLGCVNLTCYAAAAGFGAVASAGPH